MAVVNFLFLNLNFCTSSDPYCLSWICLDNLKFSEHPYLGKSNTSNMDRREYILLFDESVVASAPSKEVMFL